ncbi:hypothetical protein ACQVP2_04660 [Methylobacterium aquaticum]|uniref:hypothetical protein n=1 Tax=Methylobacterium aquaticum TaxID=270351 RepID=UPI003D17D06F
MWTDRHRTRHETRLKDVIAQTGLDEMARVLERADPPRSPSATPACKIVAAIAWHVRVGARLAGPARERRALAHGLRLVPALDRERVFEILMRALARRQRRRCGRRPQPRLAIIDTQSVKDLRVRGPRGYDGAKKVVGRKLGLMGRSARSRMRAISSRPV